MQNMDVKSWLFNLMSGVEGWDMKEINLGVTTENSSSIKGVHFIILSTF